MSISTQTVFGDSELLNIVTKIISSLSTPLKFEGVPVSSVTEYLQKLYLQKFEKEKDFDEDLDQFILDFFKSKLTKDDDWQWCEKNFVEIQRTVDEQFKSLLVARDNKIKSVASQLAKRRGIIRVLIVFTKHSFHIRWVIYIKKLIKKNLKTLKRNQLFCNIPTIILKHMLKRVFIQL